MASLEFDPNVVRWGSCPDSGQTVAQTLAKWDYSQAMRVFTSTGSGHPTIPNLPTVSWSNKPGDTVGGMSTVKDTYTVPSFSLGAATDWMQWTPWHEVDGKVASSGMVLADWHDLLDNILGQGLPANVELGVIVTAWGIAPSGGNRPWTNYWHDGVTDFGADFDGITQAGMNGSYFTTTDGFWLQTLDELDEVRTAHPGCRISVPEWGVPRLASDTTGSGRQEFIEVWAERFRDFGMTHVEWFDNPQDIDSTIDDPSNEFTAYTAEMQAPSARNLVVF